MIRHDWRTTPATAAIAATTILVSLIVTLLGFEEWAAIVGGFIPARVGLAIVGGVPALVPAIATPLSATLVHGGVAHLLMNMILFGYAGVAVERALGSRGLVALYIVGAYAAAAGQWLPEPGSPNPMIGASGAASAVLGAYSMLYGTSRARAFGPVPARVVQALWLALAWSVINIAVALVARDAGLNIAAGAHIGGFVAGLALARPLLGWRYRGA